MNNYFEKDGIHARIVARAIIKDTSGGYLFERRPSNANLAPNVLQLFGGKIDPEDESVVLGLKRELQEELMINSDQITVVEQVGAELSSDGLWLTYFFLVSLADEVLDQLAQVDNLEVFDRNQLEIESRSITDEDKGGDIGLDHGNVILENLLS